MATEESLSEKLKRLTGGQLSLLCKALEDAITEEDLSQIMVFDLDAELHNIPRAETYEGQIFNLVVKWAKPKRKIQQLVIAAALKNPSNGLLTQFVEENFSPLSMVESSSSLSDDLLASLLMLLPRIIDFEETVLPACLQTLPDIHINEPGLRAQLMNPELKGTTKWLILTNIFLKIWSNNKQGQPYIISFVQNLADRVSGQIKGALDKWLNDLPDMLRPSLSSTYSEVNVKRPSDEILNLSKAQFIVLVEPFETSQDYDIKGYVITRLGNQGHYTKFETVPLELSPLSQSGKFSLDQRDILTRIQEAFPKWLVIASEIIGNWALELQQCYGLEFPPKPDLTVEFWLPFEQLSAATESWQIYGKPIRLARLNRVLGQEYRVVVRSHDRFVDSDALIKLSDTWKRKLSFPQESSLPAEALQTQYCLDCWSHGETLKMEVQQSQSGVFLNLPICEAQYVEQREALFAWMLDNGVPLVLWPRAAGLSEAQRMAIEEAMQAWSVTANLAELESLFEDVYQARKTLPGNSLALWCDEPKRMIELREFRKGGRLR